MRRITYGGAVSLDGFLTGPDGAIDWLHYSKDVQQIMTDFWKNIDAVLMGRKTYEFARAQLRSEKAAKRAKEVPSVKTYVFSRTIPSIDDPGTQLVSSDAAAFVRRLKEQPGKDICLMGGGEFAQALFAEGLVDTVGLNIHPILLGGGVPVFRDAGKRIALHLTECRRIDGGCIMATYDVRPS